MRRDGEARERMQEAIADAWLYMAAYVWLVKWLEICAYQADRDTWPGWSFWSDAWAELYRLKLAQGRGI